MFNYMYNYLIDDKIKIDDNDTLLLKIQKFLLKYKRVIAIVLLIILLIIGYLCKIHNLYFKNSNSKNESTCILHGGRSSIYYAKMKEGAASKMASAKTGLSNVGAFAQNRVEDAKDLAPWFYGIIYSISIALLSFLIFVPAIGFIIVGLICFALLKSKISYIKGL